MVALPRFLTALLAVGAVGVGLAPACGEPATNDPASPVHQLPKLPGGGDRPSEPPKVPVTGSPSKAPSQAPKTAAPKTPPPASAAAPAPTPNPTTAPPDEPTARQILDASLRPDVPRTAQLLDAPLYDIDLDVDWDLLTYSGTQSVALTNHDKDTLRELVFFLYPNAPELTQKGARGLTVRDVRVDGIEVTPQLSGPVMRVPLPAPLTPGAKAKVELAFSGVIYRLPEQSAAGGIDKVAIEQLVQMIMGDVGRGGYGVFGFAGGIANLGLWYPILASYDDDGWDLRWDARAGDGTQVGDVSYFDVANYDVEVTAPAGVVVATTGVEVDRRERAGKRTTRLFAGAAREFTIQASKDYRWASRTVDGVKVTSWFKRAHREVGERVLKQAVDALRLYDARFGSYPYTELDVAQAPLIGGAGGVEFPGIVTVADMFYGPGGRVGTNHVLGGVMTHRYIEETLEFVVAHEVAHEWWNAVVGSDSKRHPWVDEALANHSAVLYFEHYYGKQAAERQRELQLRLNYHLARMVGARDMPVDLPADAFGGMMEYAATVYAKGALMFDALRELAGEQAHVQALAGYYEAHRFGVATPDALVDALAKAARDPGLARRVAERWLKQRHGDQDIAELSIMTLVEFLAPDLARDSGLMAFLQDRGLQAMGTWVQNLLSPDGTVKEDVDVSAIMGTLARFVDDDPSTERWARAIGRILTDPEAVMDPARLPGLLQEMGKELAVDDPELKLIFDAAGVLLKKLDEPAATPAPRRNP